MLPQPIAVIVVTLHGDRHYVLDAIRRGAAGYLLKDATTTEVIAVLRSVADGQLAIDSQLLREALDEPHPPPQAKGTVKKHVQNLIWKLRAADRTQAAVIALRMSLLEVNDAADATGADS